MNTPSHILSDFLDQYSSLDEYLVESFPVIFA